MEPDPGATSRRATRIRIAVLAAVLVAAIAYMSAGDLGTLGIAVSWALIAGVVGGIGISVISNLMPEQGPTRTCPHCAEKIKAEAKVCKHCGRDVGGAAT